ncbi:hypothetical protein MTY66_54100 [Mycolicibacterium sp. TY66]|nr:hypothetical protein MTY66_54100 [Mycolicibacterium sp. TY66]BCJ84597.1 hypothetical protein MTY81_59700 [Mycolicibacterium sp. TY81]GCA96545.1 hypothetical protein NCCNTM_01800 [Mycolicibacterium sp. NCC-Tsukiji]
MAAGGSSAAGGLWGHATEFCEGFLVADPFGVVPSDNEELTGQLDPDAEVWFPRDRGGRIG